MITTKEAVDNVLDFLSDQLSLEEFEDWSASYVLDIQRRGDTEDQALGRLIRGILNAFEDDATEVGLRQELAVAILPFVQAVLQPPDWIELGEWRPSESIRVLSTNPEPITEDRDAEPYQRKGAGSTVFVSEAVA
jgi:hypothetical protein